MNKNLKMLTQKGFLAVTSAWDKILFPEYTVNNLRKRDSIAIYPELGIVFNRIKKSGNSTITSFLADIDGNGENLSCKEAKRKYQRPDFFSPSQARKIKQYQLIAFVRNPYARVLSAFRDKVGRGANPHYESFPGFGLDNPQGFLTFVRFLEDGGLFENRHWWPQSDLLIAPLDRFDFVGRLENLTRDMGKILSKSEIDPRIARNLNVPHVNSTHSTKASELQSQFYIDGLQSIVYKLYEKDFELFRYKGK